MPFTGTLKSWNDDRGFGFIAPAQGGQEIFVHIKAFPAQRHEGQVSHLAYDRTGNGRPDPVAYAW